MKFFWSAAASLGTFLLLEIVCRLVLHLSDSVTPLIVLPLSYGAWLLAFLMLGRRANSESPEPPRIRD